MKIFKKIIITLLTFLLIDLLTVLIFSFTVKDVIINGILQTGLNNNIVEVFDYEQEEIDDTTIEDLPVDKEMLNQILETEEIKELMNDFIGNMITELSSEDINTNNLQIDKELINYLKENKDTISDKIGIEITDEMLDETSKELEESHIGEIIDKSIKDTKKDLSKEEKRVLKSFNDFSKTSTRIYIIIGIIITTIILAIIEKSIYKWIGRLSYAMLISGIVTIISAYIMVSIIKSQIQDISINTSPMVNIGLITLIFGLIISIIYYIFKKYLIKEDVNEISKVSE